MTNEKKARDISQELEKYTEDCRINLHLEGKSELDVARENAYAAAIAMAEWKDEQFKESVNKAMKYLETNLQLTEAESTHIRKLFNF